jgi:hypothetical protein
VLGANRRVSEAPGFILCPLQRGPGSWSEPLQASSPLEVGQTESRLAGAETLLGLGGDLPAD